eukprot:m51a1_g9325 hypothetical protein (104) ;mRNA; f:1809-2182
MDAAPLLSSAPFALHVRTSSIPCSGNGVFIEGAAEAGDLVALYPGVVYAEPETPLCYALGVLEGNDYLALVPPHGDVIDGRLDPCSPSGRIYDVALPASRVAP